MKLPVLVNPVGRAGADASERVGAALAAAGLGSNIEPVAGPDLYSRASELANRGARLIVAAGGDGALAAAMLRALAGRSRRGDLIHLDDVTRLRVASRRSERAVSVGGESLSLSPPLDYRIRPAALWVVAPPSSPASS